MKTLLLTLLLITAFNVNAKVYQCNGVFTDIPCMNGTEVKLNKVNTITSENSAYDAMMRKKAAYQKVYAKTRRINAQTSMFSYNKSLSGVDGKVKIGMTSAHAMRTMSNSNAKWKHSHTNYYSGGRKQIVTHDEQGNARYWYTNERGIIVSWN